MVQGLVEEILILVRCEVGLSRCLAAERLTVTDLLQIIQAACDALVAGAVEGIESTFIYLSGYHNTAKQRFLKKIAENNSGVSWFHFGDIDPDGYYILKNLIEKTGISFVPLYMDVQQLINCKQYCKPLEKNDMVKANSLLKFHFYDEVMEFMLANNCKLEQEIISWLYERN